MPHRAKVRKKAFVESEERTLGREKTEAAAFPHRDTRRTTVRLD
jgi:hypothetical protein